MVVSHRCWIYFHPFNTCRERQTERESERVTIIIVWVNNAAVLLCLNDGVEGIVRIRDHLLLFWFPLEATLKLLPSHKCVLDD